MITSIRPVESSSRSYLTITDCLRMSHISLRNTANHRLRDVVNPMRRYAYCSRRALTLRAASHQEQSSRPCHIKYQTSQLYHPSCSPSLSPTSQVDTCVVHNEGLHDIKIIHCRVTMLCDTSGCWRSRTSQAFRWGFSMCSKYLGLINLLRVCLYRIRLVA